MAAEAKSVPVPAEEFKEVEVVKGVPVVDSVQKKRKVSFKKERK
jgi:hypothetical protein